MFDPYNDHFSLCYFEIVKCRISLNQGIRFESKMDYHFVKTSFVYQHYLLQPSVMYSGTPKVKAWGRAENVPSV